MKKKYGLALGGGAARGFVHIGVLKYLVENKIEVGEIAGTSMGAIVGALFSIGKTPDEILDIAKSLKILRLIDINFRYGLIKGDKIKKELYFHFGDLKIEELGIKLKIITTNIETGEEEIFEKGSIVDAIRASISIPGIFNPYKIGGFDYIDGGIVNNLPIDKLSLRNKIGVTTLKKPTGPLDTNRKLLGIQFPKLFLNLNYQILYRTIINMMLQNEKMSISKASGNKQVLKFDFGKLDFFSFGKVDAFYKIGYRGAKKNLKF